MVSKKTPPALEQTIFVEAPSLKISCVPDEVLKEAEKFIKRNRIVEIGSRLKDKKPIYKCCEQCLKAYLLKKFSENEWNAEALKSLLLSFPCEAGHYGYFLDRGKLKKI